MLIDITKGIKVGGFDYTIDLSKQAHKTLRSDNDNGQCDCEWRSISLDPDRDVVSISATFLHEVIEAVNHVYCNDKLEHEKITQVAYGLHQVMESLGIQFGKGG